MNFSKTMKSISVFLAMLFVFSFQTVLAANVDAVGTIEVAVLPAPIDGVSEYFIVKFTGTGTLDLSGWIVSDTLASENLRHTFSSNILTDQETIKICGDSAVGSNCDSDVNSGGNNIWNNAGDSLVLKDEMGEEVLIVSWGTATPGEEYSNSVSVDYSPVVTSTLTITNPAEDDDSIYGAYNFTAVYVDDDENEDEVAWQIYEGICDSNTGALVGNVENLMDPFTFSEGDFSALVDTTQFAPGNYCFYIQVSDSAEESSVENERTFVVEAESIPYSNRISGYKWNDVNGDGSWDEGEETLPGWTIILSNGEEEVDDVITDEDGYYFFDVPDGFWIVSEEVREGWTQTGLRQNSESVENIDEDNLSCGFEIYNSNQGQNFTTDFPPITFFAFDSADFVQSYGCDFGNQEDEPTEPEPEPEQRGSGSSTGTRVGFRNAPVGQVLGVSTSSNGGGTAAPACGPFLFDYMRANMVTYAKEVMKLQYFLTGQGLFTPVTGIFDATTEANVRLFQVEHALDVLVPWDLTEPTGYVYKTTRWKINNIVCPGSEALPNL